MRNVFIATLALWLAACGSDYGPSVHEPADYDEPEETTPEPEPAPEDPSTEPEPDTTPGGRTSPDGMCGGIAGFQCAEGQWCHMEAQHPDASGTCRPNGECDTAEQCEQQDLPHIMCVGQWECRDGACAYDCSTG